MQANQIHKTFLYKTGKHLPKERRKEWLKALKSLSFPGETAVHAALWNVDLMQSFVWAYEVNGYDYWYAWNVEISRSSRIL